MNLGRGFPVPQEKQIIENGNFWTPVTPGKPVAERSNYRQAEMQQNQIEPENWQDLLGIYSDVLQDQPDNGLPKRLNVNDHPGQSYREHNSQDVAPLMSRSTLSQNFRTNGLLEQNHGEPSTRYGVVPPNFLQNQIVGHNLQDIAPLVTCSTLSQNFNPNGLVEQNQRELGSRYGVISPNFHQNQVISSNLHQNGAISPIVHQNRVISPNFHQNGNGSPNFHQNVAISSNFQQNGPISSNFQRNRIILCNLQQNGVISPNSYNNRVLLPASVEQNIGNVAPVRSMNQNAGGHGSHMPNSGKAMAPQKVHSLAELLGGMRSSPHAALTNGEPSSSTYITEKHNGVRPVSQGYQNNQGTRNSGGVVLQQNYTPQANQRIGDYNQRIGDYNQPQAINTLTSPVPSRPSYNLNFPPRSEDGESSSSALQILNQLWPATPDQQKQSNNYRSNQEPELRVDEIPNQETSLQNDGIVSQQPEIVEISSDEFMQTTLGTSSGLAPSKGKESLDVGGNEAGIDLNKTPAPKAPKRKKHRPKVVVEGKPKRTPKTPKTTPEKTVVTTNSTPSNNTPDGTPRVKRKYTRRKGIETPTTPSTDVAKKAEASNVKTPAKSCKRSLNFDSEDKVEKDIERRELNYQTQSDEENKVPIDLNTEWSTEFHEPLVEGRHQARDGKEKQQTDSSYNNVSVEHIRSEESMAFSAQTSASKNHALNVIARNLSFRNPNLNLNGGEHRYDSINHRLGGGLSQIIQASSSGPNLNGRRQPMLHSNAQHLESSENVTEKQGSQRNNLHSEMTPPQSVVLRGSQLWSNEVSKKDEHTGSSSIVWKNCLDNIKRSRIEDKRISETTTSGDCSGLTQNRGKQTVQGQRSRLGTSSNPANQVNYDGYINSASSSYTFQQQGASSSQVHQLAERLVQKMSSQFSTNMQNVIHGTPVPIFNQASTSGRDPKYVQGDDVLHSPVSVPAQRQTEQPSQNQIVIVDTESQKETKALQIYGHSSKKQKGSRGKKKVFTVDDIADFLKDLSINNTGKEIVRGEKNALVPYRETGGAIVPYEAFDIKKRVPRPKVDLDPETNRLWNLLMGKEGGETSEEMDANKQKWWEDERNIFKGRVQSFIARMHQVQGDRRFSRWKGSVVDSVIGVFLTQNVSDHLSSSAFMSLAAKFPIKSRASEPACHQNERSPSDEQKVRVTFPDEASNEHGTSRETACIYSSVTSGGSARAENAMMGTRHRFTTDNFRVEEDIFSSQSSSESFICQVSEDIRSSSGSNSEADDQLLGRNFNLNYSPVNLAEQATTTVPYPQEQFQVTGSSFPDKRPLVDHQPSGKSLYGQYLGGASGRNPTSHPSTSDGLHHQSTVTPSAGSWLSMLTGPDKWEGDSLGFLGKECTSSLASEDFGSITGVAVEPGHDKADQCAETGYTAKEAGRPKSQASLVHRGIVNKYIGQQADPSAVSQRTNVQHFPNAFQKESTFLADPIRPAEASSEQPSSNVHKFTEQQVSFAAHNLDPSGDATPGPKEMGQVHSSGEPASKPGSATPNGRKRKAEKEKAEPFNWDVLREQVHLKNGPPTGVNVNAMDSLDYEALRNADVREISDAIKERGMNNMLAERIKDFLNRLVRDHGRVDLEWLRDVQPDKAKDYLLSIRGLGLKSVECVRLLTLHHLAFPVDTNVGRIAVRLGWVPLQPLPESVQLHLLEMYPVLESIQKYLWPRLCKLDQETLYELHYQMITFGKVFCTKREPNCNACPLRAECRHFASAFASARLALPGPEEKRIVTSADPIGAQGGPEVNIRPVRLLPAGSNLEGEMGFTRNCEPIIEEPRTPEAPTEALERDIEDAFFEDPDEIPVIKLNLKEFTTNLQSFMEEHMEMQEGDMSRALVALGPGLASIPAPKLKYVSRLRTEHQVYELPDSHPLLEGMDRREPDDPSPYLLAIWTPGETADSIQPPESKCSSQEGGPCNLSTCFSCNSVREANAQTVRGTILIPCRTAMRGSFPLNGTYFQVNELFADHESSLEPIDVPRSMIWPLQRRTVFFGTSVSTIFKGLAVGQIQQAFWRGFVCVRGFDRKSRAPRPLKARLHFPASKIVEQNKQKKGNAGKGNGARRE